MLIAALALAGCGGTRHPPLSPIEQARGYGYSEQPLGGDRYAVTYVGPSKLSSSEPAMRNRDIEAARSQALDLAAWRAALIADGAGFAGFRIIDRRSSVDQSTQPVYHDTQFYAPYGGNVGAGGIVRPPSVNTTAPQTYPETPYNRLQGSATIEIELLRNPGLGDLVAKDVIRRLRLRYPEAKHA